MTTHEAFKIPVIEDNDDVDSLKEVISKIRPGDERDTLLQQTSVFIWDEFMSNHQHCLTCAWRVTNSFKNKVLLCMGDTQQIPPVVIGGSVAEVRASSHIFSDCFVLHFAFRLDDIVADLQISV